MKQDIMSYKRNTHVQPHDSALEWSTNLYGGRLQKKQSPAVECMETLLLEMGLRPKAAQSTIEISV